MAEALIEKYGTWDKVVQYYAQKLEEKNSQFKKQPFIEWMLSQESYSPSRYKKGLFFDLGLYYHAYLIHRKVNGDNNQHHMVLVCGKIGKGKSTLGLQLCSVIDSSFNMERVCYVPPHLFGRLATCKYAEANIVDEGGNFFKSRNSMTKLGRDIGQAFQLVRDLRQVLVVCYDEPEKLDKELIDKFDTLLYKTYEPNESGNKKYQNYLGFNVGALDKVKPLLKKKIPMSDRQILKLASWKGHNSIEIPVLNDLSEVNYRQEKRKYLRDHMSALKEKYMEEYEGLYKEEKEKKTTTTMKISQFAKAKGVHNETVRNWIKRGLIKASKIGKDWLIEVESLN